MNEAVVYRAALKALGRDGFLLTTDPRWPSLVSLVVGHPLSRSWWGHPAGGTIYGIASRLADRADVVEARLLAKKWTFVHRSLWPAVLGAATARDAWQVEGLSSEARELLRQVDREDDVEMHRVPTTGSAPRRRMKTAVRELEDRLLVWSGSFHTETGAHAKRLQSWDHWRRRVHWTGRVQTPAEARRLIESRVRARLGPSYVPTVLPWPPGT